MKQLVLTLLMFLPLARAAFADSNLFAALPSLVLDRGYVSSKACLECHKDEYHSWHRSYHRTMSKPALPENVQGDFSERTIDSNGLKYKIFRKGEEFWAEMPDPDMMMYVVQGGRKLPFEQIPRVERRVLLTTGSHHYETYWVGSPRHAKLLQTLPLVYLLEDKRWTPREEVFMKGPGDPERMITQWNHHCIRCHSTGGNPGLNDKTGMLESRVAEFGIACEACHGPGQKHVEMHRAVAAGQALAESDPIVNPKKLTPKTSTEVCGQCHGVYIMKDEFAMEYARNGPLFQPGADLHRTRQYLQFPKSNTNEFRRNASFFQERWWEDGTILAGGREYTALAASRCYDSGKLSCLSCHSMHDSDPNDQLKRFAAANEQCTQCHRETRFTAQVTAHTFHGQGSSGSECLNCHMPHTTYALLKGIRSHQITSPSVTASAKHGVPNACNLCHLDQTLAWTQTNLVRRYGSRAVELSAEQQKTSAALLWLLKGHAGQRAITAWHFGWPPAQKVSGTNWLAPFLAYGLTDSYGVVRYVAGRAARTLGKSDFDFLASPTEREKSALDLLNDWPFSADGRAELLATPQGELDLPRMRALTRARDNRSVTIKE